MIISSILAREKLKINDQIQILWTPINNEFTDFIRSLNYKLISTEQLYYGGSTPQLIICNNKIEFYDECYTYSRRLHLPLLLIDHTVKNPLYDNDKINQMIHFPCMHHVCISKRVSDSWDLKGVQILAYDHKDKDNKNIWKNLIFQMTQKIFKL